MASYSPPCHVFWEITVTYCHFCSTNCPSTNNCLKNLALLAAGFLGFCACNQSRKHVSTRATYSTEIQLWWSQVEREAEALWNKHFASVSRLVAGIDLMHSLQGVLLCYLRTLPDTVAIQFSILNILLQYTEHHKRSRLDAKKHIESLHQKISKYNNSLSEHYNAP